MATKKKPQKKKTTTTTTTKKKKEKTSTLRRAQNPMPDFVKQALDDEHLWEAYRRRPPFQQNDWLGWIARAKQEATRQRRLASMIQELRAGHGYMGMTWNPSPDSASAAPRARRTKPSSSSSRPVAGQA